jgi:hypothetical protein
VEFFASQIKEKTGTKTTRVKTIECEITKNDSNHVPTSVDVYTVATLKECFEDKDIVTGLLLSFNKNLLRNLARTSPTTRSSVSGTRTHSKKAHKSIELKYLRKLIRMASLLLHDEVFEPSTKVVVD